MNFAEAWAELLAGKRIRRHEWDKGWYWHILDGQLFETCKSADDKLTRVFSVSTTHELLAKDWELY